MKTYFITTYKRDPNNKYLTLFLTNDINLIPNNTEKDIIELGANHDNHAVKKCMRFLESTMNIKYLEFNTEQQKRITNFNEDEYVFY